MRSLTLIAVFVCLLCGAMTAYPANGINVSVDGSIVQFQGVGAQSINGRVLVPLRGVLERMGAFVGWDAPNRTVIAQRGDRDVVLPIGSRTAKVNGRDVQLDVPAIIMAGTTMVPLRFVGEALGADVMWNSATRTVEIISPGGSTGGQTPSTPVGITSFTHDATDWLIAGDKLRLVLKGSSGGAANFEIPGVVAATAMRETSSGTYEATWTVPANANSVSGASAIAKLVVGGQSLLIQAGTPISIDVSAPEVQNLTPLSDSSVAQARPGISATFNDGSGSGIDANSLKLVVNGKDVTADANVTGTFVSYRPGGPLPAGDTSVNLTVGDAARNSVTKTWRFTVREASQVIKSVTFTPQTKPAPGDVITVKMQGESGGKARVWFSAPDGTKVREQAMQETSAGVYEAEYTVRRDDALSGFGVVGSLTTKSGAAYTMEAETKVGGLPVAAGAPKITSPADGASVTSPLTITGTSTAGASVRLVTTYSGTVAGLFGVSGTVNDQTATVNNQGVFKSSPIDLGTLISGKDTVYAVKATVVAVDGTESNPASVKFKKK